MKVNGKSYEVKEIVINISGKEYGLFESTIKYLKSIDIELCYGVGDFPISITFPKDKPKGYYCETLRMLNINVSDINKNDWFKY